MFEMTKITMEFYKLVGETIIKCTQSEYFDWVLLNENITKTIRFTQINEEVCVSTVFLGLDHNHSESGPPHIFETMVFGGPMNEEMNRYSTWKDALDGHEYMVNIVKTQLGIDVEIGKKDQPKVEPKNDPRYRKRICLRS
jgi:hypothetical protein